MSAGIDRTGWPWLAGTVGLVVAGGVLFHVARTVGTADTEPVPTGRPGVEKVIAEAVARIAEESRGALTPPAVEAAPLPPRETRPLADNAYPSSTPPDGYSLVSFDGAMSRRPIKDHRGDDWASADGLNWLGSPTSIDTLAAQATSIGRGWLFGWLRPAPDSGRSDLATSLEGAGAEILGSAGRLLRVRLPGDEARLAAIAALPGVDGLGALPPATKIRAFDGESIGLSDNEPTPVFVTLMADDPEGRWRRELTALGAIVGRYDPDIRVYTANVTKRVLDALAAADFVLAVEPIGVVEPAHDTAVPAMGADALRMYAGSPGLFAGTGGASVPIGVMDTGLNVNHPDIAENRTSICGVNLFWLDPSPNDRDLWVDARGHGTHVTGTIAGNGYLAPRFAGMAPSIGNIRFAKVFNHDGEAINGTFEDMVNRAMDYLGEESGCADSDPVRPLIVNMSLSGSSQHWVGRDVNARKLDATVWRYGQLYVVAQSNKAADGFSNYAAAKNSLSVGAVFDDGTVAPFSSHGPTGDDRLAPQVVATGVGICSVEGNGKGAGYVCHQGTSMAAPSVAGVAALLLDAHADYRSRPALARARLMASAVRPDAWLEDAAGFPSTNTDGPGTLQARYGMGKVSARLAVLDRDQPDGWIGGGATTQIEDENEYAYSDIEVPDGVSRLDVVLTWDEPPSEAIATPVLNDLDLWLDRGGDCDDGPCGERSSASRIDNVEWIVVRNPEPGTYRAKVVPRRIYTAPPKAAISWTVVRGASTPNLAVTVDETPLDAGENERALELGVEVTTDAYVAAGARLHLECRGEDADCDALTVAGAAIGREDGLTRDASSVERTSGDEPRNERRSPIGMASRISLGEVAVGEVQSVTLDVGYSGQKPVHLYLTASAWNAQGVSHAVAILPPGAGADADTGDPLGLPANDHFANAEAIAEGEGSVTVDLVRATPEPGEDALDSSFGRPLGSVWYRWTAPSTDLVRFGVASPSPGSMNAYLDIYRGEGVAGLDHIATNRSREILRYVSVGGDPYPVYRTIFTDAVFFAEAGETFHVRAAHGEPSVPLVLRWRQGPRPDNDDFVEADALSGPEGSVDGTNLGATLEAGESFGSLTATTWYRWAAPEDGSWRFEVETDHLLRVMVFSGTDVDELRLVSGFPSSVARLDARAGVEYRIAVAARDAYVSGGSYGLSWSRAQWTPDPGDRFLQAGNLTRIPVAFRLEGHTAEPGEPAESGVRTRWWSWTAPDTGRFTLQLIPAARFGNRLVPWRGTELTAAVFSGDSLGNLELVGSTGPEVTSREVSFAALAGERYRLSLGWPPGDYGAYASNSVTGLLDLGATPANDELDGAVALGSTRGLTIGSNEFATTARGELSGQSGHSTLWWTYEPPTPGWYEFTTTTDHVLAIFEVDAAGSLREVSGDGVFHASVGKRYAIRLSSPDSPFGRGFRFDWRPTKAPAWLRFAGSFDDAEDGDGDAVRLIDAGSLAFDADGTTLYAVSAAGLTVFERNAHTGALNGGRSMEEDLSGSVLLLDTRKRLIANRCGTWRVYTGLDDADAIEGADLTVEGDPANCGRSLFLDPEGTFLYRVVPDLGIDVFALEDDGLTHEETTQVTGIRDAVIAPKGDYVYAVRLDSDSVGYVRTFRRGEDSGLLTRRFERSLLNLDSGYSLAISDDERLFVTRNSSGHTLMYDLAGGVPTRPGKSVSLYSEADLSIPLARPFEFTSARRGAAAVDVFGASAAIGLEIPQGRIDLLANGQQDRFGNRVPLFGAPNGLASSPDGRHVYVASYQHGIVAFARVGAGVEPEDPYVRLDTLEISSGLVSFASEMDSDGCIAVTDLEHDGVAYTVQSSKWQWRANADWPWTDLAGTAASGELCAYSATDPGHYRLVAEMDVDGQDRQYTSNTLVHDDHGDSTDDATEVGVPSVTTGWLERYDADYFRLELAGSGALTAYSESWMDAEGRLLDEDGAFIASDSDSGADWNFRISRDLDAGTYFVRVAGYRGAQGDYTLHLEFEADAPDLAADATLSATPTVGETFTLTITVRNGGDAAASATTLRYYRSDDRSISTSDEEIGTDEVAALEAGGSSEHSIEVTPEDDGSYSYGACVDAVDGESDTANNCTPAVSEAPAVFDLDASNTRPTGIAHAGGVLYVSDGLDSVDEDKVYVYTNSGDRDADADFDLDTRNRRASAIAFADDKLLAVDWDDEKVYAYKRSGERDSDADFELAGANGSPSGITFADGAVLVVDIADDKVYAYGLSGERLPEGDFDLATPNDIPTAIAYANGLIYVLDNGDDKLYVYETSGERNVDHEFDLDPTNRGLTGMAYGDGRFYVVDYSVDKVFVYPDPQGASGI